MDVLGRARGLVVLVEDQLTRRDVDNAWDLLDANEAGVAVELVATQLVEHDAAVDEETVRLVRSLCEEMGLRDEVWRSLRGTTADAPDGVAESLRALSSLLYRTGEPRWAALLGSLAEEAATPRPADERRQLLVTVLGLYRGMGGLDDLVLQDASGVRPEQPALDDLRRQLHDQAVHERGASGPVGGGAGA